ncbi:ribbon-helix-helix protein, CopG family [Sphingobium sp. B2]|uniref:ribbon-helix-helix protein, CopG family n=1 Tax=Sphingobium sp. B2 TaxID=2583228 RepID=UPI00119D4326|nr:ribbon-helix-helix protein, CopG family [Sphingobium sp. B2]
MSTPHVKRSVRLPADLARRLAEDARTRRASQTAVIEAALESWLSPDAADRLEGALARRLDRTARTLERLEWNVELGNEALAQFVRFWLITNAPLPDSAMKAAQAMGKERWQRFVETLARRMEQGPRLRSELRDDGDSREPA